VLVLQDRKPRHQPGSPAADGRPAPNRSSRDRQSMTWPSFANGCPMSSIWSRRARKRSFYLLSRRSFGRIESPSAKPTEGRQSPPKARFNLQEIKPTAAAFLHAVAENSDEGFAPQAVSQCVRIGMPVRLPKVQRVQQARKATIHAASERWTRRPQTGCRLVPALAP
jgi:hypothetical protein